MDALPPLPLTSLPFPRKTRVGEGGSACFTQKRPDDKPCHPAAPDCRKNLWESACACERRCAGSQKHDGARLGGFVPKAPASGNLSRVSLFDGLTLAQQGFPYALCRRPAGGEQAKCVSRQKKTSSGELFRRPEAGFRFLYETIVSPLSKYPSGFDTSYGQRSCEYPLQSACHSPAHADDSRKAPSAFPHRSRTCQQPCIQPSSRILPL